MADIQRRQKNDKVLIKKEYNRIQEKLKEIRENFAMAVTTGSRSGSGKIVLGFIDQLRQILGGSLSTEPPSCGISTETPSHGEIEAVSDPEMLIVNSEEHRKSSASGDKGDRVCNDSSSKTGSKGKKRVAYNPVPKLIDNKRKHMERQFSASQRDELLMNESKEDSQFKKDIAEAIRQSNETFAKSMQHTSMSMLQVAQGFTRSFDVLASVMANNPGQQYQYPPYQPNDMVNNLIII